MDEFNERLAQRLQITEVDWGKYYLKPRNRYKKCTTRLPGLPSTTA